MAQLEESPGELLLQEAKRWAAGGWAAGKNMCFGIAVKVVEFCLGPKLSTRYSFPDISTGLDDT